MILLSQLYRSPASLIAPLPQFLSKNPLPHVHISNTNQSIQGPHPNHLLYGGPQSGPLSTCPCHPRSRYRLTRDTPSTPEAARRAPIPLSGVRGHRPAYGGQTVVPTRIKTETLPPNPARGRQRPVVDILHASYRPV